MVLLFYHQQRIFGSFLKMGNVTSKEIRDQNVARSTTIDIHNTIPQSNACLIYLSRHIKKSLLSRRNNRLITISKCINNIQCLSWKTQYRMRTTINHPTQYNQKPIIRITVINSILKVLLGECNYDLWSGARFLSFRCLWNRRDMIRLIGKYVEWLQIFLHSIVVH